MTEKEWLACTKPTPMLEFVRGKGSERKLRLFGGAVCRLVWHLFTDERSRRAVEVVERYAEGLATRQEMAEAQQASSTARDLAVGPFSNASRRHRSRAGRCTCWAAYDLTNVPAGDDVCEVVWKDVEEATAYALDAQRGHCRAKEKLGANLARCIFGNPFRPVSLDPSWLTRTVSNLAQAAYEERFLPSGHLDPARLAVLSDALEEAGCDDADVLGHLRGPGPHVRGCWVVDLLLGKK